MQVNFDISRCDKLTNQYYKNLCRVLSLEPNTRPTDKTFTGQPQVDILYLNKLDDVTLIDLCSSNKYLNDLCNNEYFWMNRTLAKFPFLGTGEEIVKSYIPAGVGWKEYYIWMSDMALLDIKQLEDLAFSELRFDLQLLLGDRKYGDIFDSSDYKRRVHRSYRPVVVDPRYEPIWGKSQILGFPYQGKEIFLACPNDRLKYPSLKQNPPGHPYPFIPFCAGMESSYSINAANQKNQEEGKPERYNLYF